MFHSEERSRPVFTSDVVTVEGLVRVRHLRLGRGVWRVAVEQHAPVGVVVRRDGTTERVIIPKTTTPNPLLMLIAMPVVARIATKLLTRR